MGDLFRDASGARLPDAARLYLSHVEAGQSLRRLARDNGCHPSTVLRRIRRMEARRDDPLIDTALARAARSVTAPPSPVPVCQEETSMPSDALRSLPTPPDTLPPASLRILRRLAEPGASLAVARDMETALIVREGPGDAIPTARVDRATAETLALNDLIAARSRGRVMRYGLTAAGRMALKRHEAQKSGEDDAPHAAQHREMGTRRIADEDGTPRTLRCNMAESPLIALSRRKDPKGQPFLSDALVAAGERLREDFELAQMGPQTTQNWDRFLTAGVTRSHPAPDRGATGPAAARERVNAALTDLGPGLGDVVLRCCCFLEGLEATERRMGWSARSGKIVLRIALQRLCRHYEERYGRHGTLVG